MWGIASRIVLYVAAVTLGLVVSLIQRSRVGEALATELGFALALVGFSILAMQFVVSARFRWIERPFGLDVIFRFHKAMAVVAAALLACHPVLIASGEHWWALLGTLDLPWPVVAGKVALAAVFLTAFVSAFRASLRLRFETWRVGHNVLAGAALAAGFVHSWLIGEDLRYDAERVVWMALAVVAASAYVWHKFARPAVVRRGAYVVREVVPETHNVWTLKMAPPEGRRRFDYAPGQFAFLTLYRGRGLPVEEHPFTISSSPTEPDSLTMTIKASGDFTATVGQTQAGDRAALDGPYGRFSSVLRRDTGPLVFIAGGIGITPLAGMLRCLRDTGSDEEIHLIYGNRAEADILFADELDTMAASAHPKLAITHVLSEPGADWQGETGFIDHPMLERLCGASVESGTFYLCGPPVMMGKVIRDLRALGVPASRIRSERFAL